MDRIELWVLLARACTVLSGALLLAGCTAGVRPEEPIDVGACGASTVAAKAGTCDLARGHVIPFEATAAVATSCSAAERSAVASMQKCLCALDICEAGKERAWSARVASCVALAASTSDTCLSAYVGPPARVPNEATSRARER